jgi:8-oxo-dGTP diphosphatase
MSVRIAVAIVQNKRGQFLLVRRRYKEGSLHWQFPSGRIEPGENSLHAAERETMEETGVRCHATTALGKRVHPDTGVITEYWLCSYESGKEFVRDSDELDDIRWMSGAESIAAISSDLFPSVRDVLSRKNPL